MALTPEDVTFFASPNDFRVWLAAHHADRDVLWVGFWKKDTGRPSVTWEESVDEALCFGWIDGLRRRIDDEAYTIRFTPRRPGSRWSRRNLDRYRILSAAGRVEPPGASAYARRVESPEGGYSFERDTPVEFAEEFRVRLEADAAAWADWSARSPGYRKRVTHWVMSAKREETRERRFGALLDDAAQGRVVRPLRMSPKLGAEG